MDADPARSRPDLDGEVSEDGVWDIAGLVRGGNGAEKVGGDMALRLFGISAGC
jgi:hypothetical protein